MAGKKKVDAALAAAFKKQRSGAIVAIRMGAAAVKLESQKRTPVETSNLKNGHYWRAQIKSNGIVAEIGAMAEYAIYVHEIIDNYQVKTGKRAGLAIPYAHAVGEPKFLENAINSKLPGIKALLKRRTKV